MKVFEEWYNQFNNSLTSKTEKKMQERAWRAALEWIRNKCCGVRSVGLEKLNEEIIEESDG